MPKTSRLDFVYISYMFRELFGISWYPFTIRWFVSKLGCTEPLFKSSNIMKIEDVYKYKMALFMFEFSHGRLPLSFDSMFKFTHEIQNYRVTRQSHKIYIPRCKSEFVRKLPYHTLPSAWNIWSELICSDITRNKSKHKLKSTFIDTYLINNVKIVEHNIFNCVASFFYVI